MSHWQVCGWETERLEPVANTSTPDASTQRTLPRTNTLKRLFLFSHITNFCKYTFKTWTTKTRKSRAGPARTPTERTPSYAVVPRQQSSHTKFWASQFNKAPTPLEAGKTYTHPGKLVSFSRWCIALYIHHRWCSDVTVCELLSVSPRTFHLQREFPKRFQTVVYIHSEADQQPQNSLQKTTSIGCYNSSRLWNISWTHTLLVFFFFLCATFISNSSLISMEGPNTACVFMLPWDEIMSHSGFATSDNCAKSPGTLKSG